MCIIYLDLCTCTFIHDMYAYLEHLLAYVCIQFITEGMHINYFIYAIINTNKYYRRYA